MKKIRICEIAKQLQCSSKQLVLFLQKLGVEIKGYSSTLSTSEVAEVIYEYIARDPFRNVYSFCEEGVHLKIFCALQGLIVPSGLTELFNLTSVRNLGELLYRSDVTPEEQTSLSWALQLLEDSFATPPSNLLPLLLVDDMSIACAVCEYSNSEKTTNTGKVVRWHLGDIDPIYQGAILDNNVTAYLKSVAAELQDHSGKYHKITGKVSRDYQRKIAEGIKPKSWNRRPVQLACQNVVVGMADFQHDSLFEGLRVSNYLTCEVPHLATHEANRAMSAMILCDAFQSGGTMEIRFGPSKREEEVVPPVLRRFGRSLGIDLGKEDEKAITPVEARELFLAVTRIPEDLRRRVEDITDRGTISPERICFTLLASVWPDIELDYLLATSSRVDFILEGGAPFECHGERLAEQEVSRAALMAGMLFRCLDTADPANDPENSVRGFSDNRHGVSWKIDGYHGAVSLMSVPAGKLTWRSSGRKEIALNWGDTLVIVPRGFPTPDDVELVKYLSRGSDKIVAALLLPADMVNVVPDNIPVLVCPDRLSALDSAIEAKLLRLRLGRS